MCTVYLASGGGEGGGGGGGGTDYYSDSDHVCSVYCDELNG